MNRYFILLTLSVMIANSAVQAQTILPLYPGEIPNSKPAPDEEVTTNTDGIVRIAKISRPTLTVYPAPAGKATGAAVVICPGGGYGIVAAGHEGVDVAKKFNEMGVTAFVLKYRMPSPVHMPDPSIGPLQDARQALKLVRTRAKEWNIDAHRIGILGFSAGGHLASMAGTRFAEQLTPGEDTTGLRPDFMMLIYPVISFTASYSHTGSATNLLGKNSSADLKARFSADQQVTAQTPPTFLVHASDDNGVSPEHSISFYLALRKFKIPAELIIYPNGGHGFGLNIPGYDSGWMDRCAEWLKASGWLKKH